VAATFVVAVLPVWLGLFWAGGSITATALAMVGSLVLTHAGAALWQLHPGSEDVVFGDLMLWAYLKRLRTKQTITRKVQRLGLAASNPTVERTPDQQLRLLKRLAVSLEAGDPYTHGHSQRVARHASMVAKTMHLPRRQREKIKLAGLLHDIGKLYVPAEVLNKPGRLTDEEFEIIKRHPTLGAEVVERLGDPELTAMVRHHHERFDGTGYPDRRQATDIPLGARILSVADTFDALTSRRPYRSAQKHRIAVDILKKEAGTQLDADVVKAFLTYYSGRRTVGRWSLLSGGGTQLAQAAIGWFQRLGLAGVANATLAGTTAVALAATPLVSSRVVQREGSRNDKVAVQRSHVAEDEAATTSVAGSNTTVSSSIATAKKLARAPSRRDKAEQKQEEKPTAPGGEAKEDKGRSEEAAASANEKSKKASKEETSDETIVAAPIAPVDGSATETVAGEKGKGKKASEPAADADAAEDIASTSPGKDKAPKKP
jgi:putative nucleotidyltransferase with HDIG domain